MKKTKIIAPLVIIAFLAGFAFVSCGKSEGDAVGDIAVIKTGSQ